MTPVKGVFIKNTSVMNGEEKMKPLLSNRALYQNLTARVFAASAVASRIHPSLLGPKTANVSHPSLFPDAAGPVVRLVSVIPAGAGKVLRDYL